jgi:hypothetical protein
MASLIADGKNYIAVASQFFHNRRQSTMTGQPNNTITFFSACIGHVDGKQQILVLQGGNGVTNIAPHTPDEARELAKGLVAMADKIEPEEWGDGDDTGILRRIRDYEPGQKSADSDLRPFQNVDDIRHVADNAHDEVISDLRAAGVPESMIEVLDHLRCRRRDGFNAEVRPGEFHAKMREHVEATQLDIIDSLVSDRLTAADRAQRQRHSRGGKKWGGKRPGAGRKVQNRKRARKP